MYPALEQREGQGGRIGFEGVVSGDQQEGSFSVQFTPSGGDSKEQLTDEQQPSYRTFEGDQPTQASNEEINLLEKGVPSEEEKVRGRVMIEGGNLLIAAWNFVRSFSILYIFFLIVLQ